MGTPRVGIVMTEFGIASEIWGLRQAESFKAFEPVYFAQKQQDGYALPKDRQMHLFGSADMGLLQRAARKIGHATGGLPPASVLKSMRRKLLGANLDLVLCHFAWNAVAVAAAIGDALPIVCHVHGRDVTANLRFPSNARALQQALPKFARIIAVGSHQQDTLKGLWSKARADLIPCGAPFEAFGTAPLPRRSAADPVVFITVGRLCDEKGMFRNLRAFEAVLTQGLDARLVCIGDGPLMEPLQQAVARGPAAGRVSFEGLQSPSQVARHLSQAHVFLQHSCPANGSVEGFGVALTEAGAAGLPLISTRLGGIPDQVHHGENGFLIAPDDTDAQARAMITLATDEPLRHQMGAAAREIARGYDSALQASKLEALLHGVLHRPSVRPVSRPVLVPAGAPQLSSARTRVYNAPR